MTIPLSPSLSATAAAPGPGRAAVWAIVGAALALGAGCAGVDHTLFVTKSNVGLDFDTKPPTAEISVSRKEAVVAPSFEDGQTLPVLASFQARSGDGAAFKNFFLGVDQTFAGGDAAVAMTKLFDSPVPAPAGESFESALTLAHAPKSGSSRRGRAKSPTSTAARPFVFGTDTSLGAKIGWSGLGGQTPDTVKLGFNRKEFAWAPVSIAPIPGENAGAAYRVKMPSFLASIDSDARAGATTTRTTAIQYFATGAAATHLARQPAVRQAMLTRMDPEFRLRFGAAVLGDTLDAVQTILRALAHDGDAAAQALQDKLDRLDDITLPARFGTAEDPAYSFHLGELRRNQNGPQSLAGDFDSLVAYNHQLESNVKALRLALQSIRDGKAPKFRDGQNTAVNIDDSLRAELIAAEIEQAHRLELLRRQLGAHRDIVAAYLHVHAMIAPQ